MKNRFLTVCIIIIASVLFAFSVAACNKNKGSGQNQNNEVYDASQQKDDVTLGVWWWGGPKLELADEYLNYCKNYGINEIYLSGGNFSDDVDRFIQKAAGMSISTYYLCGEYQWIEDIESFDKVMAKYLAFQQSGTSKFAGVHLDVEPHQHPNWKTDKTQLVTRYINFVKAVTTNPEYKDITFDFDIPFWFDNEEYVVEVDGETKPTYQFVIDYADRVFVMSYRDEAEKIYDVAKNELAYAKQAGKRIFFGTQTDASKEGEQLTFYEEGKGALNAAIKQLKQIVEENYGEQFKNYGICIHHMRTWYALKD